MSDFLTRLVDRARGDRPAVQPILRTAYEPLPVPGVGTSPFEPAVQVLQHSAEPRRTSESPALPEPRKESAPDRGAAFPRAHDSAGPPPPDAVRTAVPAEPPRAASFPVQPSPALQPVPSKAGSKQVKARLDQRDQQPQPAGVAEERRITPAEPGRSAGELVRSSSRPTEADAIPIREPGRAGEPTPPALGDMPPRTKPVEARSDGTAAPNSPVVRIESGVAISREPARPRADGEAGRVSADKVRVARSAPIEIRPTAVRAERTRDEAAVEPGGPPVVHISIGRVEIRASPLPAQARPPAAGAASARISLAEYLKRSAGGGP